MKTLIYRPLAFSSLLFFALSCIFANLPLAAKISVLMISVFLLVSIIFTKAKKLSRAIKTFVIFTAAAVVLSSVLSIAAYDIRYGSVRNLDGKSAEIIAKITSATSKNAYSGYYVAEIKSVDKDKCSIKASLFIYDPDLKPGDVITAKTEFSKFKEKSGGFREEDYNLSKGIMIFAECEDAVVTDFESTGMRGFFEDINSDFSGMLLAALGRREGGLAAAIFLGNRDNLSPEVKGDIKTLGLSHLLALSGMHMSALAGSVSFIIAKFTRRRKLINFAVIVFTVFYISLTGFSPSVTRAGIMTIIVALAAVFNRTSDPLTALGAAAALITLVNPYAALDVGLQLSVVSMLACFAASHITGRRKIIPRGIFGKVLTFVSFSFLASVASILLTLPIISAYFGEISLVAPFSNIIFIPLFTFLLYIAPIVLLSFPAPHISHAVCGIAKPIFSFVLDLSADIAKDSFLVSLEYPFATLLTLLITASAVFLFFAKKKFVPVALCLLLTFSAVFAVDVAICRNINDNTVGIFTLNRKKSDAIVITSDSHAMIIDLSDGSYSAVSHALAISEENTAVCIDAYMLTHYHQRHVSQIIKISDSYTVKELLLPPPVSESDKNIFDSISDIAVQRDIPIRIYARDGEISYEFRDAKISVAGYTALKRSTHPAISLSIEAYGRLYLYAGSSSLEGGAAADFALKNLSNAERIYFGAHGPITKQTVNAKLGEGSYIYISPQIAAMISPDLPLMYSSQMNIASEVEKIRFRP